MKDIVDIYSSEVKKIHYTSGYLQTYIHGYNKESEKCAAYPGQSTVYFENVANITVNSESVIPKMKQNGREKSVRKIVRFLTTKTRQIIV